MNEWLVDWLTLKREMCNLEQIINYWSCVDIEAVNISVNGYKKIPPWTPLVKVKKIQCDLRTFFLHICSRIKKFKHGFSHSSYTLNLLKRSIFKIDKNSN
jgi:hypothetical protein